jgi:hypothetical protein
VRQAKLVRSSISSPIRVRHSELLGRHLGAISVCTGSSTSPMSGWSTQWAWRFPKLRLENRVNLGDRKSTQSHAGRGFWEVPMGLLCRLFNRTQVLTAPRSPWQNPYAERLIGSIRRDCLNHFVILNARHLRRTLASYFAYYHGSRTHLGLDKQCPFPRQVSRIGRILEIPQLGGLHHRYERVAA